MSLRFALVVSEFNSNITHRLLKGAHDRLIEKGIKPTDIKVVFVPGAIEIPFAAQQLAKTQRYQAILCLGAVVRGDTDHYDYVCSQVSYGCQKVMLDCEVPLIFGILTTNTFEQAEDRLDSQKEGHKGIEAADTAIVMANLGWDDT